MTDNPKKKLLIVESSDEESSIPSEPSQLLEVKEKTKPVSLDSSSEGSSSEITDITKEKIPTPTSISSSVPSTSSSLVTVDSTIPSASKSISDNFKNIDYNLEDEMKKINCNDENFFINECNKFQLKKELLERNYLSENEGKNEYLYPNLNDKNFNIKIATKKEFNDTKYEGPDFTKKIKEQADILAKADFELQPHQAFVKNYMSFQTPYSSLLLYHGLGSGKTCSAIGVTEEMRTYMKQMGITKRIIIVASENVQDNFKLQLFDERKLKEVNGIWNVWMYRKQTIKGN